MKTKQTRQESAEQVDHMAQVGDIRAVQEERREIVRKRVESRCFAITQRQETLDITAQQKHKKHFNKLTVELSTPTGIPEGWFCAKKH